MDYVFPHCIPNDTCENSVIPVYLFWNVKLHKWEQMKLMGIRTPLSQWPGGIQHGERPGGKSVEIPDPGEKQPDFRPPRWKTKVVPEPGKNSTCRLSPVIIPCEPGENSSAITNFGLSISIFEPLVNETCSGIYQLAFEKIIIILESRKDLPL